MSKSAIYAGLGQGLMSLGQGVSQAIQTMTIEQMRQQNLEKNWARQDKIRAEDMAYRKERDAETGERWRLQQDQSADDRAYRKERDAETDEFRNKQLGAAQTKGAIEQSNKTFSRDMKSFDDMDASITKSIEKLKNEKALDSGGLSSEGIDARVAELQLQRNDNLRNRQAKIANDYGGAPEGSYAHQAYISAMKQLKASNGGESGGGGEVTGTDNPDARAIVSNHKKGSSETVPVVQAEQPQEATEASKFLLGTEAAEEFNKKIGQPVTDAVSSAASVVAEDARRVAGDFISNRKETFKEEGLLGNILEPFQVVPRAVKGLMSKTPDQELASLEQELDMYLNDSFANLNNPRSQGAKRVAFLRNRIAQLQAAPSGDAKKKDNGLIPPDILHGINAVAQVENLEGRTLSLPERRVVEEEGYVSGNYTDDKGITTSGVGQTGKWQGKSFTETFKAHEALAGKLIKNFDNLPEYLRAELVQTAYRGDLGQSPKAVALMNQGDYGAAAEELLRHEEYQQRKARGDDGVTRRLEALNRAMLRYAQGNQRRS